LERLILPIAQHPEVAADRGRRPHVPSSKPTMSKSRRDFPPLYVGAIGLPIEKTQTGSGKPCPAGGAPYMGGKSARQWLFSALFRGPAAGEPAAAP
jgi:hypothetical protein